MIGIRGENEHAPGALYDLPDRVAAIFERGGHLERFLGLQHRPQQAEMALQVAQMLVDNRPLLFEAGTGVGKSLAYLIPGILWAVDTGRPLVLSTHTISLQEQLEQKDLPLCRKLFAADDSFANYRDFETAVLVGKANYLCTTRLAKLRQQTALELLASEEQLELERIAEWAKHSRTGLRHELVPPPSIEVWDQVNADSSLCNRRNCGGTGCFYQEAKAKVSRAQVRILNHSLLFSLIQAGAVPANDQRGVLFADDALILDEAHRVPAIATEHFGLAVSSYGVDFALKRLWNPRKKQGTGVIQGSGRTQEKRVVEEAVAAAEEFFGFLGESFLRKRELVRITEPGVIEPLLHAPLQRVIEMLRAVEARTENEDEVQDLRDHQRRILGFQQAISSFLDLAEADHVHWLERSGRRKPIIALRTAPLNVAPYLRESILQRDCGCLMTSATLSIQDQMTAFESAVGAEGTERAIEASPFDYEQHMRVFIAIDAPPPDPKAQARLDRDYLCSMIHWCASQVSGGSLVLFTSYGDLNAVADLLIAQFAKDDRPVFVQGRDQGRTELTASFAGAGNGILLGTESFWTGVDVPGPALSQVIISRLPFENPTHPIPQARKEAVEARGGNAFAELALPEALLKFRQGVGRLIRSHSDRGCVTVLDSRILNRAYGRRFIEQLPVKAYQRFSMRNREQCFPRQEGI